MKQKKRSARMRTRAKQKHVASDRARRENVPRHILFHAVMHSKIMYPENISKPTYTASKN